MIQYYFKYFCYIFFLLYKYLGGLAVAVPGELKGFWELHQKYGRLNWSDLFEPIIDLCEKGHIVAPYLARILQNYKTRVMESPSLREVYVNPATDDVWVEGDSIKRLKLAETFKVIAKEGASALYNGSLTKQFVKDIQDLGGIITEFDMESYRVTWDPPVKSTFLNEYTIFSPPAPASGILVSFMLNVLDQFLDSLPSVKNYHRIVETFKYAYAKRSELGDMAYEPSVAEVCFMI